MFGPRIRALPQGTEFNRYEIDLRPVSPEQAAALPALEYGVGAAKYVTQGYVDTYNAFRNPDSDEYIEMATSDTSVFWGVYARDDTDNRPIGLTNISNAIKGEIANVNIAIADPAYHNRRIASHVAPFVLYMAQFIGVESIATRVHHRNMAALQLAKNMGFVMTSQAVDRSDHNPYINVRQVIHRQALRDPLLHDRSLLALLGSPQNPPDAAHVAEARKRTLGQLSIAHDYFNRGGLLYYSPKYHSAS